jgi:60Kd inner membrane protein
LTATIVRAALLYPAILGNEEQTKLAHVGPAVQQAMAEVKKEIESDPRYKQNPRAAQMLQSQTIQRIHKSAGLNYVYVALPIVLQLPLGFGTFRVLRALTSTPGIGMTTEGFGWIKDLTVADPYYILPTIMAGSMYLFMKVNHPIIIHLMHSLTKQACVKGQYSCRPDYVASEKIYDDRLSNNYSRGYGISTRWDDAHVCIHFTSSRIPGADAQELTSAEVAGNEPYRKAKCI